VSSFHRFAAALLLLGLLPSLAAAQTAPRKYLCFGDSITEGTTDDPARAQKGYPPRLQVLLQQVGVSATVVNAGKGGEQSPVGLERIDEVIAQGVAGDVLIVMEGTNDITREVSVETTVSALDEMANRAEAKGLSVIHATVIPRYPEAPRDSDNLLTDELNGRVRNVAGVRSRRLADPNEVFRNTPNLFAGFYSTIRPDPVGHPNSAGYDILANVFFNAIQNIDRVSPVPGIVRPVTGSLNVAASTPIEVDFWDFGAGIDLANTFLLVNGQPVSVVPTGSTRHAHLTYQSPSPLSGTVRVGLRSRDLAVPANSIDREIAHFSIRGAGLLQGDLNADRRVDGADLVSFGRHFGSHRNDLNWDEDADFNADGAVDGLDLAVLASNFGRTAT
jgi:lysophospholipase L1-like esterase